MPRPGDAEDVQHSRDGQLVDIDQTPTKDISLEIVEAHSALLCCYSSSLRAPLEKTEQRRGTRLVVAVCLDS